MIKPFLILSRYRSNHICNRKKLEGLLEIYSVSWKDNMGQTVLFLTPILWMFETEKPFFYRICKTRTALFKPCLNLLERLENATQIKKKKKKKKNHIKDNMGKVCYLWFLLTFFIPPMGLTSGFNFCLHFPRSMLLLLPMSPTPLPPPS